MTVRCFIACFPDAASAAQLSGLQLAVAGARRVPPGNLHLTLAFLGEIDAGEVTAVIGLVSGLPGAAVTARVQQITGYPHPQQARVIVAELEPCERLAAWHVVVTAALPATADRRDFRPHVTLARCKRATRLDGTMPPADTRIRLKAPALYRSETLPEGPRYTRLS